MLTARRGYATAELFSNLNRVEEGDTFSMEVSGDVLSFRVIRTQVVQPADTDTLLPRRGADLMTLVTCAPLGINTHRILFTDERIILTPDEDRATRAPAPRYRPSHGGR